MTALERFLIYVKIHTASSENLERTPTEEREFDLSRVLEKEMKDIGLQNVFVDEHAYVYGSLPATPGCEERPCVGFIAHLDTIPDFSGENVKPQLIENYDGGDVALGASRRVLTAEINPNLPKLKGHTLVTTDGTTVLGADDKAGIAAIMTACERIAAEGRPHGAIAVCFTPDEEVGHGASLLDLERFGADFAYTVDGGELEEINFETFNAASAKWEIRGFNIHPGSAKDKMINASLVAMEINAMLPCGAVPERTEGYEGFFHLTDMSGSVEKAELSYILRDHDASGLAEKEKLMRLIEKQLYSFMFYMSGLFFDWENGFQCLIHRGTIVFPNPCRHLDQLGFHRHTSFMNPYERAYFIHIKFRFLRHFHHISGQCTFSKRNIHLHARMNLLLQL